MTSPFGERPDANNWPAAVRDVALYWRKRATRSYGAAQTSCGSSRSSYWRLPPVRTIGSPLPGANLSGDADLRLDPDTETIVALSWLPAFPICTVSPVDKPVPLIAVVDVAPAVLTPAVAVLSAPGDTAATATTVQEEPLLGQSVSQRSTGAPSFPVHASCVGPAADDAPVAESESAGTAVVGV